LTSKNSRLQVIIFKFSQVLKLVNFVIIINTPNCVSRAQVAYLACCTVSAMACWLSLQSQWHYHTHYSNEAKAGYLRAHN